MNTRIYKNEFDPAYIAYLKKNYKVESETDNVLELTEITEEDDRRFHAAMFKSFDDLCQMLPETFKPFETLLNEFAEKLHKLYYGTIIIDQLHIQQSPAWEGNHIPHESWEKYMAISHCLSTLEFLTK